MSKKIKDMTKEELLKLRQKQAAKCSLAQDRRRMGLTKGKWGFK